jgi:DNA-3-methyladenine glycosylase
VTPAASALHQRAVPRPALRFPAEPPLSELRDRRLPLSFFRRDVATVARALVGTALVKGDRAGIIVETEAYLGPEDLASHARFGPTARTSVMFGPGGVSYVYLCYGMHEMFNIVAERDGQPGAVLIRALAPLRGLGDDPAAARGPGKLTRALGLSRADDRLPLDRDDLFVARWQRVAAQIAVGPRVGVDYAGACAERPLRFWLADHPSVSKAPRSAARRR